jgi:hypothetical protein
MDKDLNVRSETLKLLQENISKTHEPTSIGNNYVNRISVAQKTKARIDKWVCIKLKSFCIAKEIMIRVKSQSLEWEKIFAKYSCDRELISRTYKELKTYQRTGNPINKWTNELNSF